MEDFGTVWERDLHKRRYRRVLEIEQVDSVKFWRIWHDLEDVALSRADTYLRR